MKAGNNNRRGFMCRSPWSTAVCMTGDHRSVIVPRRQCMNATTVDHSLLMVNKYSRVAESNGSRFSSAHINRPMTLSSALNQDRERERECEREQVVSHAATPLTSSDQAFQVVVMRVSLHCQGCAGKLKKHISKMEGVTSFSIDLETKRVTVTGHVSAKGVLESISKVKRAEFWPS
ncbi:hypothetical protein Syun_004043 [Stephania yunnanensis]|uniref:HMA domain-containing protein n=1 Tax=Stephania yunnanensis TaxID=152371 RepID=A0AAP0L2K4_9MAGN